MTPYTGVCIFFSVKFATSLLASLAGGKQIKEEMKGAKRNKKEKRKKKRKRKERKMRNERNTEKERDTA